MIRPTKDMTAIAVSWIATVSGRARSCCHGRALQLSFCLFGCDQRYCDSNR